MNSRTIFGFLLLFLLAGLPAHAAEVSLDAQRHMAHGTAAMRFAKSPADFRDAVKEFGEATKLAPDWADAWFNLGVAQESAEDCAGAIGSFKTYLEKNPKAADRNEVQTRIFGLEYKQERQAQLSRKEAAKRDAPNLTGTWRQHESWGYRDYQLEISGQQTVTGRCIDEVGDVPAAYRCKVNNLPMYFHGTLTNDGFNAQWSPTPRGSCSHIKEELPIEGRISPDGMILTISYQYESFVQSINSCISSRLRGQRASKTWTRLR